MAKIELNESGMEFALPGIGSSQIAPRRMVNKAYAGQLNRGASSCGADYRAACTTSSESDFINKLKMMAEDWRQTAHFLNLLGELNPDLSQKIQNIRKEGDKLISEISGSINLLKG